MATTKRPRRDSAQVILRMEPADRARIQAAIPRGSLNSVARQLLLDYARAVENGGRLPLEEDTTTAA